MSERKPRVRYQTHDVGALCDPPNLSVYVFVLLKLAVLGCYRLHIWRYLLEVIIEHFFFLLIVLKFVHLQGVLRPQRKRGAVLLLHIYRLRYFEVWILEVERV